MYVTPGTRVILPSGLQVQIEIWSDVSARYDINGINIVPIIVILEIETYPVRERKSLSTRNPTLLKQSNERIAHRKHLFVFYESWYYFFRTFSNQ